MLGAIIGAVAGIGGALLGSSAQKKAAKTAADAVDRSAEMNNALARDMYSQNTRNMTPYMQTGQGATNQLNLLLSGDQGAFDAFRKSTPYHFQLTEGLKALNHGYAANGMLQSGAAMKGITKYAQDYAGGALGNYMGALQGQQNVGMAGASALAGVGQNLVNNVSQNNNMAASANANAALMRGAANANMYGSIAGSLGGLAGQYLGSSYGR